MYGGGVSNGSPSTVSLEAQTMLVTAARRAALKTFQVQPMLFMKVRWSATLPGAETAARCTTASSLSYLSSTPSIASSHLAVVGQVDRNEHGAHRRRMHPIEHNHVPAMTYQLIDAGSSELARTTGHDNTRHCPPPS